MRENANIFGSSRTEQRRTKLTPPGSELFPSAEPQLLWWWHATNGWWDGRRYERYGRRRWRRGRLPGRSGRPRRCTAQEASDGRVFVKVLRFVNLLFRRTTIPVRTFEIRKFQHLKKVKDSRSCFAGLRYACDKRAVMPCSMGGWVDGLSFPYCAIVSSYHHIQSLDRRAYVRCLSIHEYSFRAPLPIPRAPPSHHLTTQV